MIFIRYKHSKLASIISAFGAALVVMGFYLLGCALGFVSASEGTGSVAGDVLGGIVMIVVGAVIMFVANKVAASKEVKYQEKMKAKTEAKLAKAEAKAAAGTNKKMGMGQKVGIVLICIQIILLIFSISQGNPIWVRAQYQPGASAAGMYVGYFLPTIIGVILLLRGNKKAEATETTTSSASAKSTSTSTAGTTKSTYTSSSSTSSSTGSSSVFTTRAHICPKCGGDVEDEDNYCIHCGAPIIRR